MGNVYVEHRVVVWGILHSNKTTTKITMNLARLWMSRASPRHNHKFNSGAVHEGGTFWTHWWLLFSSSDKRTNEQTDKQTASSGKHVKVV